MENLPQDYQEDLLIRMAYHNAGIEGNSLTFGQTYTILLDGRIPANISKREFYEVDNHIRAMDYLFCKMKEKEMDLDIVKDVHRYLTSNINIDAGTFRKGDVLIKGANFQPIPYEQVLVEMTQWVDNTNYRLANVSTSESKIEAIVTQHLKFEKIHPFSDGNGRTGRMLMLLSCLQHDIPPFIFEKERRAHYIDNMNEDKIDNLVNWAIQKSHEERQRIDYVSGGTAR